MNANKRKLVEIGSLSLIFLVEDRVLHAFFNPRIARIVVEKT